MKRNMLQYGLGIMALTYFVFLYIIWRAYYAGYEITLNFNNYGEGLAELVIMTISVIPVVYSLWVFATTVF